MLKEIDFVLDKAKVLVFKLFKQKRNDKTTVLKQIQLVFSVENDHFTLESE